MSDSGSKRARPPDSDDVILDERDAKRQALDRLDRIHKQRDEGLPILQLLPELEDLVLLELSVRTIQDVLRSHPLYHEPAVVARVYMLLCQREFRSPLTGQPYRMLVNYFHLFAEYCRLEGIPAASQLRHELEAKFWPVVYGIGHKAIRLMLMLTEELAHFCVDRTSYDDTVAELDPAVRELAPSDTPRSIHEDIPGGPHSFRAKIRITLPDDPDYETYADEPKLAAWASRWDHIFRNNWLAIGDESRRVHSRVSVSEAEARTLNDYGLDPRLVVPPFVFVAASTTILHINGPAPVQLPRGVDERRGASDALYGEVIRDRLHMRHQIVVKRVGSNGLSTPEIRQAYLKPTTANLRLFSEEVEFFGRPLDGTPASDGRVIFRALNGPPVLRARVFTAWRTTTLADDDDDEATDAAFFPFYGEEPALLIHYAVFTDAIDVDALFDWITLGSDGQTSLYSFMYSVNREHRNNRELVFRGRNSSQLSFNFGTILIRRTDHEGDDREWERHRGIYAGGEFMEIEFALRPYDAYMATARSIMGPTGQVSLSEQQVIDARTVRRLMNQLTGPRPGPLVAFQASLGDT
jgi:hypothetical protein